MTRGMGQTKNLIRWMAILLLTTVLLATIALADKDCGSKPCKRSLQMFPMRFVVIGDRTGGHVPGVYGQVVMEIERLKPDFVLSVGDMIEGYTDDESVIREQYEEYKKLLKPLSMPIYLVPGNHDIWDDSAVDLYREYIGEPDHSFDVRGVHFVMLDTGRYEAPDEVRDDQIEWLKADLAEHKDAYYTVAILHKPFWIGTVAKGKPDKLHDIFVANGVDAVFTGHYHRYFAGEIDGIKYTGVGSSGGGAEEDPTGLMFHFVWATFDGSELSLAPIKIDAVLPWDQMTAKEFLSIGTIKDKGITMSKAPVRDDLKVPKTKISLTIDNLCCEAPIENVLKWEVPKGWEVRPEGMQVKVDAGESLDAEFTVRCKGPLYPVPSLTLKCPYRKGKTVKVEKDLSVFRTATARKAGTPPVIDGELTEKVWAKPTTTFFSYDTKAASTEPVDFYFAYDRDNLYLAAKCTESEMDKLTANSKEHDGPIYAEDCVGYFFQTEEDGHIYQMYFNPLGTAFDQKITIEDEGGWDADKGWNGEYEVKTLQGSDFWCIEARIPLEQLGAQGAAGKTFALNFRRKQFRLKSAADWQTPVSYDPDTFGILVME